jgi:CBS domain containing-hemolysin-like protein
MITTLNTDIVNTVSQLIQLSVAPVFLLAGVAGLLNVFTGRLTRIIDKVEKLNKTEENKRLNNADYLENKEITRRRKFLAMRMENTNLAILFCTTTGLLVALVIVTMFLSALFGFDGSTLISILFILAMISLILSLIVFLKEIFYTTSFIKTQKNN